MKYDLVELGTRFSTLEIFQMAEGRFSEAPFDGRVDRCVLAFDDRLYTILELVEVALERGLDERNDVYEPAGVERVEVARLGRREFHETDQLVVHVERVKKEATMAVLFEVVLVPGPNLGLLKILNDDGVGALEDPGVVRLTPIGANGRTFVAQEEAPAHGARLFDRIDVGAPVEGDQAQAEPG